MSDNSIERGELLSLTADIISAYAGNNSIATGDLPGMISAVYEKFAGLGEPEPEPEPTPAVPIRKSVTDDLVICLECGRGHKVLKKHLTVAHDTTPDAYRKKWRLGHDYPMIAPSYSEVRKTLAKRIHLGRKAAKPRASGRKKA